jgi:SAM-dependent methyltransferase
MANPRAKATRGHGLLEPLLAHLRAQKANKLIPDHLRTGRILDIGCGSYPYFLSHTYFAEKFAVDQLEKPASAANINWHSLDLNSNSTLPFEDGYFDLVTMLAVVEHLAPNSLVALFQHVHRVLRPGGRLIITTPAAWSDSLLHRMARIGLVSEDEINEHVYVYTLPLLGWYFGRAGFEMTKLKFGYFEFNMNLWATADR